MSFSAKKPRRTDSEMSRALEDVAKEPTVRLNVEISESMMWTLKRQALDQGVTLREYVTGALVARISQSIDKQDVSP